MSCGDPDIPHLIINIAIPVKKGACAYQWKGNCCMVDYLLLKSSALVGHTEIHFPHA
jgi:hypothetical protein